jgi:hypothetical protein
MLHRSVQYRGPTVTTKERSERGTRESPSSLAPSSSGNRGMFTETAVHDGKIFSPKSFTLIGEVAILPSCPA